MAVSRLTAALVFARDGLRCQHCGTTERLTIDHVIPRSGGGGDEPTNLQTLCHPCNARKGGVRKRRSAESRAKVDRHRLKHHNVRIAGPLRARAKTFAERTGQTMTAFIETAMQHELDRHDRNDDEEQP